MKLNTMKICREQLSNSLYSKRHNKLIHNMHNVGENLTYNKLKVYFLRLKQIMNYG